MTWLRALIESLRLRLALLLLVAMASAALLGGFVTWRAVMGAGSTSARSPAAILHHLPDYGLLLVIVSAGLTLLAVRRVTRPLAQLADAAAGFASSLDPRIIALDGATEFGPVLDAFNAMQQRVSDGVQERLHMLSAINHDLRTPMARLALRIDQVDTDDLRSRLQADVAQLEAMVARGMDLARSGSVDEPMADVDLAALLQTIADNALAAGDAVRYEPSWYGTVRTRPETLMRCLTNLVDNAVRYGSRATMRCETGAAETRVLVLDRGPGIPDDQIETAFRPFTRLGRHDRQVDGSGLGLTIARQQARSFGGDVTIANRAGGGLVATVSVPAGAEQRIV